MSQLATAAALVLACAVLAGCAPSGGPGPAAGDPREVQASPPGKAGCVPTTADQNARGAQATNAARRRAGLPPVRSNMLLAEVAARHACDMASRGVMTHRGSRSSGPGPRVKARGYAPRLTAENIAAGPFDLPRVLSEWNRSQGHLDNIMIPQVRDYGIGQAVGADGRTRFWAAVYAAPK
ncbi:CAP domain-containing protein [Paracoccus spongiarum]|uniref:CAP domain-containing protein n=1 Tax=Paracoccus spongiarum TaxID=3064387 RepID=A0ABT9JAR7_9RHOB|nr:CAP domain-containing protein [Paracoccus sp. 2205BS29-5]MDP5306912.1 CAP domain-containing protein [Paracoccus sp. 2205BS29-5]